MKNLVLGTAFDYRIDQLRPFVESLRRHYDGDVALLVNGGTANDVLAWLESYRVEPIFFDAWQWIFPDVQVARYVRYADELRGRRDVARVLLTDVGDVVFQVDPFGDLPEGELLVFMEDESNRLGTCPNNAFWLRELYGAGVLEALRDQRVSCSGTTIGTRAAVQDYLDAMLMEARPDVLKRLPLARGFDQGMHNRLLHAGRLPRAVRIENGTHVLTLACVPDARIATTDEGISLVGSATRPAIVHQYPYKPAAADWVARHLASGRRDLHAVNQS